MHRKEQSKMTYPFQNVNGYTIDVWAEICNFIPHCIIDAITYLQYGGSEGSSC